MRMLMVLAVRARSARDTSGRLSAGGAQVPCSIGRSGRRVGKREGDGATPIGSWRLTEVLYRADRVQRPQSPLPIRRLRPDDGWCDAIGDRNYNRHVRHPYPASAERLWRDDHVYDLIVVMMHNLVPRVQGSGSAIFIHLARPDYAPTEGCVALGERDLRLLLAHCSRRTRVVIGA